MSFRTNKFHAKGYRTVEQFLNDEDFRNEFIQAEQKTENETPREYIKFGGLLTIASTLDIIQVMNTYLVQCPLPTNDFLAIARCELNLKDGTSYSGIGDSDGKNTVDFIAKHRCRVAETRADARALRKALGVTILAFEEMEKINIVDNNPITHKQIEFIGSLVTQKKISKDDARNLCKKICGKVSVTELNRSDASALIDALKIWSTDPV